MNNLKATEVILITFFFLGLYRPSCLAQVDADHIKKQTFSPQWQKVDELCNKIEANVISWRREIHQNPEFGNREFKTSQIVADQLKKIGLKVQTGVAHTGVVEILKEKYDGPVVALRADMDALPVKELVDLPFAPRTFAE